MSATMQALRIESPGHWAFADVPRPEPREGEVLLQIKRIGYCGSDLSTFRGANPLVQYPRIPGHEIAAVVAGIARGVPETIQVGAATAVLPYTACGECASCRAGRTNACQHNQTLGVQRDGALTEYIAVPWQKLRLASLSLPELALVEPLSVGFHAAARGRVGLGDTVLVLGCGMIGLGAIAGAAARGATVIAADVAAAKLGLARKSGAAHVIDSSTENLHGRLVELTGGHGPAVVIEAVGSPATYVAAVEEVAFAGRVVYIGYGKAPVSYETKLFVLKELDILGSRNATDDDFDAVIRLLGSGRYPSLETITRTAAWAEAGEALAAWSGDPGGITKLQITVA